MTQYKNAVDVARSLVEDYGSDISGETIEDRIEFWIRVGLLPDMYDEEFGEFFGAVSDEIESELERIGFEAYRG